MELINGSVTDFNEILSVMKHIEESEDSHVTKCERLKNIINMAIDSQIKEQERIYA